MKKLNFIAATMILVLTPFLQSCLDDDGPSYSDLTIATLKATDADSYYFGLDSGRKMYPSDDSAVRTYRIEMESVYLYGFTSSKSKFRDMIITFK